jgi:hypothetical protein
MERIVNCTIIETQEESEKDDEIIFKLLINGQTMSWAKTTLFSNLDDIHTANVEKRKGYGGMLLNYIEENAKSHSATSIDTNDFNTLNREATSFLRTMFYEIKPSVNCSVKGTKIL